MLSVERIARCGIIPVVVLDSPEQALPTARALLAGGIDVMEITFRTAAARDSIAAVAQKMPDMIVGAGTVINAAQLEQAAEAGAQFIVCPGTDRNVILAAQARDLPVVAGVVTPSEIMLGLSLGLDVFKFFPAEAYGGLKTIKALSGPFPQIRFIPTGGIDQDNAADYFKSPKILAVGGCWIVSTDMVRKGRFDEITEKSRQATERFRQIRG